MPVKQMYRHHGKKPLYRDISFFLSLNHFWYGNVLEICPSLDDLNYKEKIPFENCTGNYSVMIIFNHRTEPQTLSFLTATGYLFCIARHFFFLFLIG